MTNRISTILDRLEMTYIALNLGISKKEAEQQLKQHFRSEMLKIVGDVANTTHPTEWNLSAEMRLKQAIDKWEG